MTFFTARPLHPGAKVLLSLVVATGGVLGSVGLSMLSRGSSSATVDTPAYTNAMQAQSDAILELNDEGSLDLEFDPTAPVAVDPVLVPLASVDPVRPGSDQPGSAQDSTPTSTTASTAKRTPEAAKVTTTTAKRTVKTAKRTPLKVKPTAKPAKRTATTVRPIATTAKPTATTGKDTGTTGGPVASSTTRPADTSTRPTAAPTTRTTAPSPPTAPTSDDPPPVTPRPTAPTTNTVPATIPPPPPASGDGIYRVTVGSGRATEFNDSSPPGDVSAHGTRIYCVISHFSHDDPVVFPRRQGASHAHMYWGNTEADARSTGASLQRSGNSSCEGGINNRSSYWTPALFNEADEVVLPETVFVYYKSFGGPGFNRSTIRPIPPGLEMLATRDIRGAGDWDFRVGGSTGTQLMIVFPSCIAVDGGGRPVLSSDDNVSHLSYATEHSSASGCPSSHPYRIPTVSYVLNFAVPYGSNWYLASDDSSASKGRSLHADYVAAWDVDVMDRLVDCTIRARRSCGFPGRDQLPERFLTPDGNRIYRYSVTLEPNADRTPFGTLVTPYVR